MILEDRSGRNRVVEVRSDFGSSVPPTWAMLNGQVASGGRVINAANSVGIPTVVGALQLISGSAAALPFMVYNGVGEDKEPALESWQYQLMEVFPGPYTDPFQLKYDIFWCIEAYGNAFVLKVKDPKKPGVVKELIVLDPDRVAIRNDGGVKTFDVKVDHHRVFKGATVNEILHIKNMPKAGTMFTGTCGLQQITARLGLEMTATEWEGRFFQNDATPPIAIILGDEAGVDEMRDAYESWMQTHAGPYNAGRPAIIGGGATIQKLSYSFQELQLTTLHEYNVMEIARAMNLPLSLFVPPHTKPALAEDEAILWHTFYLSPRLRRVESAFSSDPDFFAFNELWCRFNEKSEIRPNTAAQATAYHAYVQDGVLLKDEVRAELGYGPLPEIPTGEEAIKNPGKVPQITPVGGAPNDLSKDLELVKEVHDTTEEDSNK